MKLILPILLFFFISYLAWVQNDSPASVTKPAGFSLKELMNTKVVTASGIMQTIAEAPSTITVITAKQIEHALRNMPGSDMIHVNGCVHAYFSREMWQASNYKNRP